MPTHLRACAAASVLLVAIAPAAIAQHPAMPPGMTHDEHLAMMQNDEALKKRGAAAMGFDQDKTAHHFLLTPEGGRIEVGVTDPADQESRSQIRAHLKAIAGEFARGHFDKPFATHGEMPPGVKTMRRRRAVIAYAYDDTPEGGRVRLISSDRAAIAAVHDFLKYQIRAHATGDPLTIGR